ncbi:hypothetical protein LTR33_011866 [Friedmanniomyces endolithicus]|nr:hypothetical protein LTR33_011866 [Friedmanniomyces endolithicus]
MTSEADSEDSRPKKLQKKRKGKKDDGAADAKNDPTGPSAAEKYAKELLDSRRPTKRRRRRNRTLDKYGYTDKNAKDQELSGTNLRLDIGKFMGTWRNLKITLEEIMSDEMPGAARFPPEKHTHMGRMCISWLRMVRRVLAAAKQAREDDEGIPEVLTGTQREKHSEEPFSGVPWFGEDIHRALCYIQVVKGKNKKSKYAAHAGERSSYGGSVVLPRFHYPDTFKARIHLSPQTHVGIHLGVFPITRLPKRLHLREQYIRQLLCAPAAEPFSLPSAETE